MAESKMSVWRQLDDNGLAEQTAAKRRELMDLRFRNATGELENTASVRGARRDLARALTLKRERELMKQTETAAPATTDAVETLGSE